MTRQRHDPYLAEQIAKAVAAERELCAEICDDIADEADANLDWDKATGALECAAAIRKGE